MDGTRRDRDAHRHCADGPRLYHDDSNSRRQRSNSGFRDQDAVLPDQGVPREHSGRGLTEYRMGCEPYAARLNESGMRRLMQDKVTLGAEATVAAGPVGRSTAANTDAQMSAEILSYSRSKGLFAGIALQGATLRPDQDVNRELYGSKLASKDILMTGRGIPDGAKPLVSALNRYSHSETGDADRAKTKKH